MTDVFYLFSPMFLPNMPLNIILASNRIAPWVRASPFLTGYFVLTSIVFVIRPQMSIDASLLGRCHRTAGPEGTSEGTGVCLFVLPR